MADNTEEGIYENEEGVYETVEDIDIKDSTYQNLKFKEEGADEKSSKSGKLVNIFEKNHKKNLVQ